MNLEQRLVKLERSNRIWKRIVLAGLSAAMMLGVSGAGKPDVIECDRLIVRDPKSDLLVEIGFDEIGGEGRNAVIKMGSEKLLVEEHISLRANENNSRLNMGGFMDISLGINNDKVSLVAGPLWVTGGQIFFMGSENLTPLIIAHQSEKTGAPVLQLNNPGGEQAILMSVVPHESDPDGDATHGIIGVIDTTGIQETKALTP